MSYVQRVFYVAPAPEPVGISNESTLQWIAYNNADAVAPEYPATGTFDGIGDVIVHGMYSLSGALTSPGEALDAEGTARIEVSSIAEIPLDSMTLYSRNNSIYNSFQESVLGTGPAWFWRLDETSGVVAADATGNGALEYGVNANTAGYNAAATTADGIGGSKDIAGDATRNIYDPTGGAATIGSFTGPDFTIDVAFTIDTLAADMYLLAKLSDVADTTEYAIRTHSTNSDTLEFIIYEDDLTEHNEGLVSIAAASLDDGLEHFLSLQMDKTDSNRLKIYIDGVLIRVVGTSTWGTSWLNVTGSTFCIGNDQKDGTKPWGGRVDEVALYQKVPTVEEKDENYNWWAEGLSTITYGTIDTIDAQTAFELEESATSYRGAPQLRQNFRTSDTLYRGYTGDNACGVPAPIVSPVMVTEDETEATNIDADTRFYLMTYVNAGGYESAPGPINPTPVQFTEGDGEGGVIPATTVQIAAPLLADVAYHPAIYGRTLPQDYVPVVEARIYRTNTGTTTTGYQFVRSIRLDTSPVLYPDIPNSDLGEALVTEGWDVPPPFTTAGCKMANGTYLMVHEFNVYMSVPGVAYAWPVLYTQIVRDNLVHIEAVGTSAIALSDGGPYLIAGGSPDTMEIIKLPFYQPCEAVRAVSVYLDLLIYPAPDGLMGVSASGKVINLTEKLYEEHQWRVAYNLKELVSVVHDATYYAFQADGSGFAFDLKKRIMQPIDTRLFGGSGLTAFRGLHYDTTTDSLYISETGQEVLYEWDPLGAPVAEVPVHVPEYAPVLQDVVTALAPVHYYKFDETSGGIAVDTMGANDLEYWRFETAVAVTAGQVATSRRDGVGLARDMDNNQVSVGFAANDTGTTTALDIGATSNFTVECAFYLGEDSYSETDYNFIYRLTEADGYQIAFRYASGYFHYVVTQTDGTVNQSFIGTGLYYNEGIESFVFGDPRWQWISIVMDYTGTGTLKVYVDNIERYSVDVSSWSGTWASGPAPKNRCSIGPSPGSNLIDSFGLDEWAMYDKALSSAERLSTFNAWDYDGLETAPLISYEPVLQDVIADLHPSWWWTFDETSGTTVADVYGNDDLSANRDLSNDTITSSRADGVGAAYNPLDFSARLTDDFDSAGILTNSNFTIELAIKRTPVVGYAYLFDRYSNTTNNREWNLYINRNGGIYELWMEIRQSDNVHRNTLLVPDMAAQGVVFDNGWSWLSVSMDYTGTGLLTANLDNTQIGSIDASTWSGSWKNNNADWFSVGGAGSSGSGDGLLQGLDEIAIYKKMLTTQQRTATYTAWIYDGVPVDNTPVAPTPVPATLWDWESKEFYIPDRSYGAMKLTGVFDASNQVEVTLNSDGVDQPLFPISSATADGIVESEGTFRLPAVRGSKLVLKLKSLTGAPEVHTVQVAVHPTEII